MTKRTTLFVGILSLLSLGQQLLIKTSVVLSTAGSMLLVPEKIYAENTHLHTTWGNKKEVSVDDGVTLKDLRKLEETQLNDSYGVISDYKKEMEIYERIYEYTKAIEINPNNAVAYYNRGIFRRRLDDYYGAISDYTKAIEIYPNDSKAYLNRGFAKGKLKDYYGAISDFTKAIEINPKYAFAFANRGTSKESIGDMQGACDDWGKASSFGHENAANSVRNQC